MGVSLRAAVKLRALAAQAGSLCPLAVVAAPKRVGTGCPPYTVAFDEDKKNKKNVRNQLIRPKLEPRDCRKLAFCDKNRQFYVVKIQQNLISFITKRPLHRG